MCPKGWLLLIVVPNLAVRNMVILKGAEIQRHTLGQAFANYIES